MACIRTFTGRLVNPINLKPEDVCIEDIAHALSLQCRFNGHVRLFYSVAEHSYRASFLVPEEQALAALMHDRSEAYLPDMTRPVKYSPWMYFFRMIEHRVDRVTAIPFGVPVKKSPEVEAADKVMCAVEQYDLMNRSRPELKWLHHPYAHKVQRIKPFLPLEAEERFLTRYEELIRVTPRLNAAAVSTGTIVANKIFQLFGLPVTQICPTTA